MLVIFLVLVQFCLVFSQSGNQFISYHIYGDGQTSSACYPSLPASNWAGYITANTFNLPCGTCVKMTSVATSKTIYVYAIDIGGRGFDLNLPAFCELCGDNPDAGFASGGCNINWQVVDKSLCSNWIAGKSKPNCNLCPSGSTCNNPDPNRNGGVNWNTYCPGVIDLGSGVSMKRCEMRIDGCTCSGGSNPTPVTPPKTPVTPVTPVAPVAPKAPGGKGKTSTRCGANWSAANSGCGVDCVDNSACTGSDTCFASLDMTPCGSNPTPVTPPTAPKAPVTPPTAPKAPVTPPTSSPKGKTKTRCGSSWSAANSACGKDCTDNSACTAPSTCYADLDLTPCGASSLIADDSSMTETSDSKGMIVGISVGAGVLLLAVIIIAILMVKRRRMEEIV